MSRRGEDTSGQQDTAAGDRPGGSSRARPGARHGTFRVGFTFGLLSFLSVALVGIFSMIFASRIYGVRIIGQFALVSAPVGALYLLSTVREQSALIKEITVLPPRHPRVTQLFAVVFSFSSGLTFVASALAALVSWLVFRGPLHHPGLVMPALVGIAGYALVTNTATNIESILAAFVAGRQLFWVRLHEALAYIVMAVALGLAWRSVWGLVIATIGSSLTGGVHRAIVARPFVRGSLSWAEYRAGLSALPDLIRFGLKITPGAIAGGLASQAGIWAVGVSGPVAAVGAYGRAAAMSGRFQEVNVRVVEILYPTLVGRRARGDGPGFDRALIDSVRYTLGGMLLIAAVVGGAAHSILDIFGPGFNRATGALALLVLAPVANSVIASQTQALWAVDRPTVTSILGVARLPVVLVLTFVLTPRLGISGAALAMVIGMFLDLVCRTIALLPALHAPLHVTWPVREQLALVAAYGAGFAAAKLGEHLVPSLAGLPLAVALGAGAFALVLVACGAVNGRDRERLADVLGRISLARANGSPAPATAVAGSADADA